MQITQNYKECLLFSAVSQGVNWVNEISYGRQVFLQINLVYMME